jgi:DNA invertase Pin-like site-specific DNA recombinase
MPDLLDTIRKQIDTRLNELRPLAREASDLQRVLDALNEIPAAPNADGRSPRRQADKRAVSRRPRRARGDVATLMVEYVAAHPGSTARAVADALGLKRSSVATRLTRLAKDGRLVKARRGYSAPERGAAAGHHA